MSRSNSYMKFFAVLIGCVLILMMGAVISETAYAEGLDDIGVNEYTFPDEQFRHIILDNVDRDKDELLSPSEIQLCSKLTVSSCYDLKGIEYLTNLKTLDITHLYSKERKETPLDLSANIKLESLSIGYANYLYNLNLKQNTALRKVQLNDTALENVDFSGCEELQEISMSRCYNLRNLNVYHNPKLETLYLNQPEISNLYLSENVNLKRIEVVNDVLIRGDPGNIPLESIDLSGASNLQYLIVSNCSLKSLDLSKCASISYVKAEYNYIESFKVCPSITLEQCYLRGNNNLKSVSLPGCDRLKNLSVEDSNLEKLDIRECPVLCRVIKYGSDLNKGSESYFRMFQYVDNEVGSTCYLEFDDKTEVIYDEGTYIAPKRSIANAFINMDNTSYVYTGKAIKPQVRVVINGTLLSEENYTVAYKNNTNVGTATVTVTGKGCFEGTAKATFKITKATNNFTAKGKTATAKYSQLKKGSVTLLRSKVIGYSNKKGTLTYTKSSGNSKITINKTTGKLKIAKGLKKGTYKVKVKVKDSGSKNYKAKTVTVTITVKVK